MQVGTNKDFHFHSILLMACLTKTLRTMCILQDVCNFAEPTYEHKENLSAVLPTD